MKTSTQLSRRCWVKKTNLRDKRNFTWGGGIHRSPVSQIIHKVLHLKCYKNRRAQQLTEAESMHALFLAYSFRDDNVITSKRTWKLKHANSILEPSEYFCQTLSKSIHIVSSYTVSKLGRFLRQCRCVKNRLKTRNRLCKNEKKIRITAEGDFLTYTVGTYYTLRSIITKTLQDHSQACAYIYLITAGSFRIIYTR